MLSSNRPLLEEKQRDGGDVATKGSGRERWSLRNEEGRDEGGQARPSSGAAPIRRVRIRAFNSDRD